MIKVQVLTHCEHCNGEAYLPIGEAEDCQGHKYTRDAPCPMCEGSDRHSKRVSLANFDQLPRHPVCGVAGLITGYRSVWSVISGSGSGSYFLPAARTPPE